MALSPKATLVGVEAAIWGSFLFSRSTQEWQSLSQPPDLSLG